MRRIISILMENQPGALSRVVIESYGLVELTLLPAKHAEHVDGVADGDVIAPRFGRRDRGRHAVFGGPVVCLGEVATGDPAKDGGRGGQLVATRERVERFFVVAARLLALSDPLCPTGALDERSDGGRRPTIAPRT